MDPRFPRTFTSTPLESKYWLRAETGIPLRAAERRLRKLPRYRGLYDAEDLISLRDEVLEEGPRPAKRWPLSH